MNNLNVFNKNYISIDNFDYEYYRKINSDLYELTKNMSELNKKNYLYKHFIIHGQKEGRHYRLLNNNKNKINVTKPILSHSCKPTIKNIIDNFNKKIRK